MRIAQNPESDLKLVAQNQRPDGQQNIVERDPDYRSDQTASCDVRPSHGSEGFQSEDRNKSKEDTKSRSPCNGMWCVFGIKQIVELG